LNLYDNNKEIKKDTLPVSIIFINDEMIFIDNSNTDLYSNYKKYKIKENYNYKDCLISLKKTFVKTQDKNQLIDYFRKASEADNIWNYQLYKDIKKLFENK
jgi:hypothetical protein